MTKSPRNTCPELGLAVLALLFLFACGPEVDEEPAPGDDDTGSDLVTQEFLDNGDFDGGRIAPWRVESSDGLPLIVFQTDLPVRAHSGAYAAWLGGSLGAEHFISQEVTIPETATAVVLSIAVWVVSTHDRAQEPVDTLDVALVDANGLTVAPFRTYSNRDQGFEWRTGTVALEDVLPVRGRTLRLSLRALTDPEGPTSFFVDSLSLSITYGTGPA